MSKAWLKCGRDLSSIARQRTPTRAVDEGRLLPGAGPWAGPAGSVLLQAAKTAFRYPCAHTTGKLQIVTCSLLLKLCCCRRPGPGQARAWCCCMPPGQRPLRTCLMLQSPICTLRTERSVMACSIEHPCHVNTKASGPACAASAWKAHLRQQVDFRLYIYGRACRAVSTAISHQS